MAGDGGEILNYIKDAVDRTNVKLDGVIEKQADHGERITAIETNRSYGKWVVGLLIAITGLAFTAMTILAP